MSNVRDAAGGAWQGEPERPAAEGDIIEIPITKNADGTVTLTLTEKEYASVAVQLAIGAAVLGG